MTYPATTQAPAGADVVTMVLDQYGSILHRYADAVAGDVAALRHAASVVRTVASGLGDTSGQLARDISGVDSWHGTARERFDHDAGRQVHRLELVSGAANRCAQALETVTDAIARATEQTSLVSTWFGQAARVISWVARIPGVDANWAIGIAYRVGERAVGLADAAQREVRARLVEFIAAVHGAVDQLAHDFPAGDAGATAHDGHPHPVTGAAHPRGTAHPATGAPDTATPNATPVDGSALPARYQRYLPYVMAAAQRYHLDPALIMAVMDRETGSPQQIGNGARNIIGDYGHGHGLMQIDDRSHGAWLRANNDGLDPASNIDYGASLLRQNLDRFNGDTQAALAAYNSGAGNVHHLLEQGRDPDARTTGHDYGADTLRRYEWFRQRIAQ
jgi:hypothetical protein